MSDSRTHILETAANLFMQKSYKEVTMKEIVDKTGLSKGAFYLHFRSKEQLFMEVTDYFFSHRDADSVRRIFKNKPAGFLRVVARPYGPSVF
jgi:AcrR family transcriptional regulator